MLYYSTCRANRWIPKYTVISIQCIHYPLVSYCSTSFWKCRGFSGPTAFSTAFGRRHLYFATLAHQFGWPRLGASVYTSKLPVCCQFARNCQLKWFDCDLWVSLFWILFCEATPGVVHSTWCYWPASFAKRIWSHGLSESPIKSMSTCIGFSLVERRHAVLKPLLSEGGK